MLTIESKGSFRKTERFFKRMSRGEIFKALNEYGREGVIALSSATPKRTGTTAGSWDYTVKRGRGSTSITWTNYNENKGVNIAIILQYGHGTGTGGYVRGRDYINPAIIPVFNRIADGVWKVVTSA